MTGGGGRQGDFIRLPRAGGYDAVLLQQGQVQLDSDWNEQALLDADRRRAALRDLIGPHGGPAGAAGFAIAPIMAWRFADGGDTLALPLGRSSDAFVVQLDIEAEAEGPLLTLIDGDGGVRLRLAVDGEAAIVVTGTLAAEVASIPPPTTARIAPLRLSIHVAGAVAAIDCDGIERVGFLRSSLGESARIVIGGAVVGGGTGFAGWLHQARVMIHARDGAGGWRVLHEHGDGATSDASAAGPRLAVRDLSIGAGRYYVDGVACHLPIATSYARQPDLPGDPFRPGPDGTIHLLYLDVWEQLVSAIQDPMLTEPALGGSAGSVRTRTVAQIRSLALGRHSDDIDRRWAAFLEERCTAARLRARRHPGYRGAPIDSALYRIEVHAIDEAGEARLKWSRRNASASYPLLPFGAATNQLRLGAVSARHVDLAPGDWIELLDDNLLLRGEAGQLARVEDIDADALAILADRMIGPPGGDHPFVRRWDGAGADGTIGAQADAWIDLENGIQVSLNASSPRVGDFWVVETRAGAGELCWPQDADGPRACPPDGIAHRYAPIAVVRTIGLGCAIEDARLLFRPATAVAEAPLPVPPPAPPRPGGPVAPPPPTPKPTATLPPGTLVLADTPTALPGCDASTWSIDASPREPAWQIVAETGCDTFGAVRAAASAGGVGVSTPNGALFGFDSGAATLSALPPPAPLGEATIAATRDHLVLFCATTADGEPDRACWRMAWSGGDWSRIANLPVATSDGAVATVGDSLRIVGGRRRWWWLRWKTWRGWRHDDEAGGWRRAPALPWPRAGAAMATASDGVVIAGGRGWPFAGRGVLRAAEPAGRWRSAGRLEKTVAQPAIAIWERQLFVAEGDPDAADPGRVAVRPIDGRRWSALPPLPAGYAGWALVARGDDLLAFGLGGGALVACALPLRRRLHVQCWRGG